MTARTAFSALFVSFFPFIVAFGRLDHIDADGVTDTGGPGKARMLTRTNSDGKIDTSLIPPLGELVLTPDTQRLYVSSFAARGGDGSAVAPYRTLNDAFARVMDPGSVVIAPGPYSGTLTLKNAQKLTLIGCHTGSLISTLTITVSGTSDSTELTLLSTFIGNLIVNGGKVKIRMQGSLIGTLSGSADITVERCGLCSRVGAISAQHVRDSYIGYDTVPYAQALKGESASLVMTGNRPTVGAETGAFLSDVAAATGTVYGTVAELRVADAVLAGDLMAASNALDLADETIMTELHNSVSRLDRRIDDVYKPWEDQMSELIGTVEQAVSAYTNMNVSVTNEIQQRKNADTAVRTAFAEADAELHETIRNEVDYVRTKLENEKIPELAREEADMRILAASNGLVSAAKTEIQPLIDGVITAYNQLSSKVDGHDTPISKHTTRLSLIKNKLNAVIRVVDDKHGSGIGVITDSDWGPD